MPVEVCHVPAVVVLGGSRVGVVGEGLPVAKRHNGIQCVRDRGVAQPVRADVPWMPAALAESPPLQQTADDVDTQEADLAGLARPAPWFVRRQPRVELLDGDATAASFEGRTAAARGRGGSWRSEPTTA